MAASPQEGLLKANDSQSKTYQPLGRSRATSLYAKFVKNGWLVELLSLLLGIAALIALCALLNHYNKNPAPRLNPVIGYNITLNTLVSILSTISRAALLLSVSECISQSKWSWFFDRQRPLEDLDVFDKASRGAWGGLNLLWRVNVRQIASIGAVLIIGGLAIDPLSQQLVHYGVRMVQSPGGSATLPAATTWKAGSQDTNVFVGQSDQPQPPLAMVGAIQTGLFSQNTAVFDVQPVCSSGNCTWPSYRSLAICARSADVTSSLKTSNVLVPGDEPGERKQTAKKWYLSPQNFLINDAYVLANLSSAAQRQPIVSIGHSNDPNDPFGDESQYSGDAIALNFSSSIAFKDSPRPLADVFMIYANTTTSIGGSGTFSAIEFVLEWCVQNFTTTVAIGRASTERHDSFRDFNPPDPNYEYTEVQAMPDDGDNRQYTITSGDHYILQSYFRGLFQGTVNLTNSPVAHEAATNDATQAIFQPFDIAGETLNGTDAVAGRGVGISGLQGILDNMATGMTNMIRTNDNLSSIAGSPPLPIQGTASQLETYVKVQWGWIAAPIVLLVGSVVFFLAAVISSLGRQKPEIWKSSSLPLLKALSKELQVEGFSGMRTISAIEDWAQSVPVRLSRDVDGDGWKLVRRWSETGQTGGQELQTLGEEGPNPRKEV